MLLQDDAIVTAYISKVKMEDAFAKFKYLDMQVPAGKAVGRRCLNSVLAFGGHGVLGPIQGLVLRARRAAPMQSHGLRHCLRPSSQAASVRC